MADNPSAGGGKIRPRRAPATRKPYARASSQRKSLFSRVTDSVKSLLNPIAPKWLVSRLGHDDDPQSPRTPLGQDSAEPSTSVNHQESYSRTNNNYKRSPLARQPLKTSVSKTSTSSLQYYITPPDTPPQDQPASTADVGTGKEGLVKHLTMASKRAKMELDSPAISDSSYLRSEMKLLSTNDNVSVASSSGCSSSVQVGSQRTSDNETSQRPPWSSSMESLASSSKTSSSRQQATMSSHKRPRFNPAIFGMPALGVTRTPDFSHSSFYEGPVQFGGANASGRSTYFATPYKIPSVTKVKVRHVNHQRTPGRSSTLSRSSKSPMDDSSVAGMSSTAKKILLTLEKMSSPLNDARKIPTMARTPSSFAADRRKRRTIAGSSILGSSLQPPPSVGLASPSTAKQRRRSQMPLNNSLLIKKTQEKRKDEKNTIISDSPGPSTSVIPDSKALSIRGLPAPIASMSSSASMPKVKSPPSGHEGSGGGGKMKSQKRASSHYSAMHEEDEEDDVPNLPNVPLPVSSLPSFNFGKSLMTSTPSVRPHDKTDHLQSSKQPEFNFASPLIKTTHAEQTQSSANNTPKFQFSSPPTKGSSLGGEQDTPKARPISNFAVGEKLGTSPLLFAPDPKVVAEVKAAAKRRSSPLATPNTENSPSGLRPAESLRKGSVMDVLGGKTQDSKSENTSKPPSSNLSPLKQTKSGWTCTVCMVPNDDTADSCVACTTPKLSADKKAPLSSIFAKSKGWDCGTCMVPNDADTEKCVACETPKPGSSAAASASKPFGSNSLFKTGNAGSQTQKFSFGLQSKKDSDKTAPTSMSLNQQFKKPQGSWECTICLVRNDASSTICDACQTPKSGTTSDARKVETSAPAKTSTFKFGIQPKESSKKNTGWGNLVKKATSSWECEVCMVPNPEERKTCEACDSPKPGTKKELNTSFKFGENSSGLFKFGVSDKTQTLTEKPKESAVTQQEKGDAAQSSNSVTQATDKVADTSGAEPTKPAFSFGVPATSAPALSAGTTVPGFGSSSKPVSSSTAAYSFGQNATAAGTSQVKKDTPDVEKKAPTFAFGVQKKVDGSSSETSNSPAFGASSASLGFTFGSKPQTSTAPAVAQITKSTPQQANPLFGGSAIASQATTQMPAFGAASASTSQPPPPYQPKSFDQQTESKGSKPEEQTTAVSTFNFGAKPAGVFPFSGAPDASKPLRDTSSNGATPFNFGGAKPTQEKKSVPNFGIVQTAATTASPSMFAGFGAPAQQTKPAELQKTEPPKASFNFMGSQNPASQPSAAPATFGGTQSARTASPFATPSKAGFTGASNTPFGTPSATGSTNFFGAANAGSSSAFGTPGKPATPSTIGGVFGSNSNTNSVFGGQSATSSTIPKPSFAFGQTSNNDSTKDNQAFQFGGNTQQQPSAGFAFGKANQQNNPASQSAGFNFGGTPSKPAAFNAPAQVAPSAGFAFGGQPNTQSNGVFQFGSGGSNQPSIEPVGGNKSFPFGGSNNNPTAFGGSNNITATSSNLGFNFAGSAAPSFNFAGSQPQPGAAAPMFSGDPAPNLNPFSQQSSAAAGRSTTPVQGRRRIQARRKLKK